MLPTFLRRRKLPTPQSPALSSDEIEAKFVIKPESAFAMYIENLTRYRPGGFHPVSLGDAFKDGRYTVKCKLGYGGSSTVWLARDGFIGRWVALKILSAERSASRQPVATLKALHCRKDTARLVPALYDSFLHTGANGIHLCLTMELLGPTLDDLMTSYIDDCDDIDPEDVLILTRSILQGLATFHEAGIARGNLHGSSLVFTIRNVPLDDDGLPEELADDIDVNTLDCRDGTPLPAHMPHQLPYRPDWWTWREEDQEELRFVGTSGWSLLGDAFSGDSPRYTFRPPEALFDKTYDGRADLWHAGCLIYYILFRDRPFVDVEYDPLYIANIIGVNEDLPAEWEPAWQQICATSGPPPDHILRYYDEPNVSLEQLFKDKVSDVDLKKLLPVLRGLLRFRPQDRISAREALALLP